MEVANRSIARLVPVLDAIVTGSSDALTSVTVALTCGY
jgi:hypothetical protein